MNLPAGHVPQGIEEEVKKVPAVQRVQADAATVGAVLPAAQAVHSVDPSIAYVPRPHIPQYVELT